MKSDCHLFLAVLWVPTFPITAGSWPFLTSNPLGFHFLQQAVASALREVAGAVFFTKHVNRLACLQEKHNSIKQDSTVCLPIRLSAPRESWQMELEEMLRAHWLIPFSQRDQSCLIQPWLLCLWFNKLKLQHSRCHSSPGQSKCFSRCFPWRLHQHFQGRTALPVHTESSWETSSCKILHSYFCLLPCSVTLLAFPAPLFSSLHPGLEYRSEKSPRGIVQHSQMCYPLSPTV